MERRKYAMLDLEEEGSMKSSKAELFITVFVLS